MPATHDKISRIQKVDKESSEFARTIAHNKIQLFAPVRWIALACKDFVSVPFISVSYGVLFSLIPMAILYFISSMGTHLVILPACVAFALIGPVFAVGLYDVAWQRAKEHKPTFSHSFKAMFRNSTGSWGFVVALMLAMLLWMRIAALIHAFYPDTAKPTLEELTRFLAVGSIAGFFLLVAVFSISAFAPQIMVERKVDVMSAMFSSASAVWGNIPAMICWSFILMFGVFLGFLSQGWGFIFIMPVLSFASWHAYIATLKVKCERNYE